MKKKSIKSLGMMNYLVRCGHDCIGADDNENNTHFKVFFFEDTDKLQEDISNYNKTSQK